MKKDGYYSSGQFAKMAHVTLRTVRFYDKKNILKPSLVTETGARFYTAEDFSKLQQILLLKYLGFSLDEIKDMLIEDSNSEMFKHSLVIQKKLIQDKIEQMQMVADSIDALTDVIDETPSWEQLLDLIHLTAFETGLKNQYQNAENISARIRLHAQYSVNKTGWFPWLAKQCGLLSETSGDDWCDGADGAYGKAGTVRIARTEVAAGTIGTAGAIRTDIVGGKVGTDGVAGTTGVGGAAGVEVSSAKSEANPIKILEIGCGNGELWTCRKSEIRRDIKAVISDISQGMVRDARRNIGAKDKRFSFKVFDAASIPYEDNSFDMVIANHMLFYCEDIEKQLAEIQRVLKPGGKFLCSTYGSRHMREITEIVQEFDSRIVLSAENLYDRFGLDDGENVLSKYFQSIECRRYDDEIVIDKAEPLIEYIRSCHGNQNQYLLDRYADFKDHIQHKVEKGFHITKDAGVFICIGKRDGSCSRDGGVA